MISFMACWMALSTSGSSILETTSKLLSGILIQSSGVFRLRRRDGVQSQDRTGTTPQGSDAAEGCAVGGEKRLLHAGGRRKRLPHLGRRRGGLGLQRGDDAGGDFGDHV